MDEFARYCDCFSVWAGDLTPLNQGADRDTDCGLAHTDLPGITDSPGISGSIPSP